MIEIIENQNRLVGKADAIKELAEKEEARIIIISDSHGNPLVFKNIVRQYGKSCHALAFCGDGISDLAHLLEDAGESAELKDSIPPVLAFVQGNCDPANYILLPGISPEEALPSFQVLNAAGKSIYICHGHNENVNYTLYPLSLRAQAEECQIALYGHTHCPDFKNLEKENVKIINPGSACRPRGGNPASFAILTITQKVTDVSFIKIENPFSANPQFKIFQPHI